jgi:hypothetical protein
VSDKKADRHEEPVRDCLEKVMSQSGGWATIDQIVTRLDAEGCWPAEFLARAMDEAKKQLARRLIRQSKDEKGWPTIASVETVNADGQTVRVYKQETLFEVEDYKQVVQYHHERSAYHRKMREGYRRRAKQRFGVQLPIPFPALK